MPLLAMTELLYKELSDVFRNYLFILEYIFLLSLRLQRQARNINFVVLLLHLLTSVICM